MPPRCGDLAYMTFTVDQELVGKMAHIWVIRDEAEDFAGTHEAYDTRGRSWQFGTVGGSGKFQPKKKPKDFVAFITDWYAGPAAG